MSVIDVVLLADIQRYLMGSQVAVGRVPWEQKAFTFNQSYIDREEMLYMRPTFPGHPFTVCLLQENRSLTIKLRKRKPAKKVEWSSDTVDNEHMGRRSSKCELCTYLCPIMPCHHLDTCKCISYIAEPACPSPDMLSGNTWHMQLLFPISWPNC